MRILVAFGFAAAVAVSSFSLGAQNPDPRAELRQKLTSQFVLTRLTDDRSDFAFAGTMGLLHKSGVEVVPTSVSPPPMSSCKNGKISLSFTEAMRAAHNTDVTTNFKLRPKSLREGSGILVADIMVENDGVIFRLVTGKLDNGSSYYGDLLFPFPNDTVPPVDDMLKTIAEVVTPMTSVAPAVFNLVHQTFALTKLTQDNLEIDKAGSVLVLHKDGLVFYPLSDGVWPINAYKDGKITLGPGSGVPKTAKWDPDGTAPGISHLAQNSGYKFWLVEIVPSNDGVGLAFYTDEINGRRYISGLYFPFPKDRTPQPEEIMKTISEVVTVDPGSGGQSAAASGAPQSSAPPAPIAPPPPPVDAPPPAPKTIALSMTRDVVIAILGQPQKVVKLGAKEIDIYPDMKVTFTNGKVSDVQ